ncbi:hypothetical protein ACEUZ9_004693 [Paracoccus litorisediminis]|uniref:hypothetical protein n=1 Tax=Paracoccus litorisediminis TaxID=2006130 RepID=UPI00372F78A8
MLPLIPAMLAMTMVLALVIGSMGDSQVDNYPSVLAGNMLMQHDQAIRRMQDNNLQNAEFGSLLSGPIKNLGNWRTRVISHGGMVTVITWSAQDSQSGGVNRNGLSRDTMARVARQVRGKSIPGGGISSSGQYIYTQSGGMIGEVEIVGYAIPVAEGDYAVVSLLEGNS